MIKKALLSITLVVSIGIGKYFAQCSMYEISLTQRIQNSDNVFEGSVVSSTSFWNSGHTLIYTSNIIDVYKEFKGKSSGSQIEIITEGGTVGDKMHVVEPSLHLNKGETGIFFTEPAKVSNPNTPFANNALVAYAGSQGFIKYDINKKNAADPFKNYSSIEAELYTRIESELKNKPLIVKPFDINASHKNINSNNSTETVPVINSFSPTTITAGTGSILTINGSGFGATQGASFVEFKNADNAGTNYIQPDVSQYMSWSDAQITVKVPSKTSVQANAGTGTIQVTVASNTAVSSGSLTIKYSEINLMYSSVLYQTDHADDNGSGGYTWQMFTGFDGNAAAKASFTRALNTWTCGTGINWGIGTTTSVDVIAADNINVVRFDIGAELPAGVLGRCSSYYSACGSPFNWSVNELDIVFDAAADWNYSTSAPTGSQYDFESVALHELGHGHQLNHVINTNDVMHYAISNAVSRRILNLDDLDAGNDLMSRSTVTNSCGPTKMIAIPNTAPTIGTITQTTCITPTGGVVINSLPAAGTWTLTRTPGGTTTTGTGISSIITGLAPGTYTYTVTNAAGCTSGATANVVINAQPPPTAVPTVGTITQTTCSIATGGVVLNSLPASGTWTLTRTPGGITTTGTGVSSTITGLAAGTYTYTVTNASLCISAASANVVINAQPTPTAVPTVGTITQTTCNSATGGVVLNSLPASGTWTLTITPGGTTATGTGTSSTITGLAPGTYTYTVTNASGCISAASVNVVINAQPTPTAVPTVGTITQTTCSTTTGGVVLNSLPATGTWTLTITPGGTTTAGTGVSSIITGLTAGTYTYTVTNASGCISATSANVVINAQPTIAINFVADNNVCNGDTEAASSFSSTPAGASYTWTNSNTAVGLTASGTSNLPSFTAVNSTSSPIAAIITVTPSLNGCVGIPILYTITVNPVPAITQNGVILTSSTASTYQWYLNSGAISGAVSQSYTVTQNGNYTVVVDGNACPSNIINYNSTGIEKINENCYFSIYPNPNDGKFDIAFNIITKADYTLKLINSLGALVYQETLTDFSGRYSKQMDLTKFGKGVYLISISSPGMEKVKKVVIY